MRGCKSPTVIRPSTDQLEQLRSWTRHTTMPAGPVRRARAILLLAEGRCFAAVQRQTGMARRHLRKWARRFQELGPAGLYDERRPGRRPVFPPRGGDSPGEAGLRAARPAGPVAVPVGLRRA